MKLKRLGILICAILLTANNPLMADLTNGLVAYYPFNGNASDASGNGNDGIVYGATLTIDRFGDANAAYDFDGSDSYIDIQQNSELNNLITNFTLSAWIYQRDAIPPGYRILDKCDDGAPDGWTFDTYGFGSTGHRLRLQATIPNSHNVAGATDYSLLQWHHVVATVSGTTGKVYLDGNLDGTGDVGDIPANTLDVFIGHAHPRNGAGLLEWFDGTIDDVRIYNRTLSDVEVSQLYSLENGGVHATSTAQTSLPAYAVCPERPPGKDSLVVVTHGWQPYPLPTDVSFVDELTNAISQELLSDGQNNWQLMGYKWVTGSWTVLPETAINNAIQQGLVLGNTIGAQQWTNVHLIAHSAGAALIESVSERIKAISPNTVVQCTFLDAFLGSDHAGVTNYGKSADWSDNYFSRDVETGGGIFSYTQGSISNAYNVDVTQLDVDNRVTLGYYVSQPNGVIEIDPCYKTESSHGWPITFYQNTIDGNVPSDYDGFGFPLSIEAGLFLATVASYPPANTPARVLGTPDPSCSQGILPTVDAGTRHLVDFVGSLAVQSAEGVIQRFENGVVHFYTGSPVWLATVVANTNAVNLVSFDAAFTSTSGSRGLLSVYWDTNMIGQIDEGAVQPGFQHYTLSFPNAVSNDNHVLGLHLDPFTVIQSSILLTNVTLSQSGVSQAFSLTVTTNRSNDLLVYQLTGQANFNYVVQASPDLVTWTNIAILANTNGAVYFVDPSASNYASCRFYRAVSQ